MPTKGTPVTYRLPSGPNQGQYRAATVTEQWADHATLDVDVRPEDNLDSIQTTVVEGTAEGTYQLVSGLGGGETNTASNLGAGTGVYASKVGVDLQFKGLSSANSNLTISSSATTVTLTPPTTQAAITSLTDNTGATANNTIENVPLNAALTDNTGGTASTTLGDPFTSGTDQMNGQVTADNFASLAARNAELRTALTAAENSLADLAAKVNAILTALRSYGVITT